MRTFRKIQLFIFLVGVTLGGFSAVVRADSADPRTKVLLEEALRLYSERQYVRALDLFKQVERIDPENKTAAEYIKSSEARILEWENQGGQARKSGQPEATWDTLLNTKKRGGA